MPTCRVAVVFRKKEKARERQPEEVPRSEGRQQDRSRPIPRSSCRDLEDVRCEPLRGPGPPGLQDARGRSDAALLGG